MVSPLSKPLVQSAKSLAVSNAPTPAPPWAHGPATVGAAVAGTSLAAGQSTRRATVSDFSTRDLIFELISRGFAVAKMPAEQLAEKLDTTQRS